MSNLENESIKKLSNISQKISFWKEFEKKSQDRSKMFQMTKTNSDKQ